MNSLSSLLKVCHSLPHDKDSLSAYEAARFSLETPKGKLIADVGCEPILHMRDFQVNISLFPLFSILMWHFKANNPSPLRLRLQATKRLPEKLIDQILHNGGDEI